MCVTTNSCYTQSAWSPQLRPHYLRKKALRQVHSCLKSPSAVAHKLQNVASWASPWALDKQTGAVGASMWARQHVNATCKSRI